MVQCWVSHIWIQQLLTSLPTKANSEEIAHEVKLQWEVHSLKAMHDHMVAGIQSSHFCTIRPQFSVQIPMHFTLQFSSANDYARVQLVGIFLEFPTMLLSMHQWGEVCSLCNFMILCIWAVSQLKAKTKEYTIWVIFHHFSKNILLKFPD